MAISKIFGGLKTPKIKKEPQLGFKEEEIIAPKESIDTPPRQERIDFTEEDGIKKLIDEKGQEEAEKILRAELKRKRENLKRTKEMHKKNINIIDTHPKGVDVGLTALVSNDTYAMASNSNLEYRRKALKGLAEGFLVEAKQNLSTTHLGLMRDKELTRATAKAVIDGDTSNPLAARMANEINKMNDFLRERFNSYGGDIGKLRKGGYLPQSHDAQAIRKVSKDEWKDFIKPLLDDETSRLVNRGALDLDTVYDTITTGGLNKIQPTKKMSVGQGKSTINRHAEERVLNFKDGESWIAYQEKFGTPDIMATLDNHIQTMVTDMAMVEIFGPNPEAMYKTLKDYVRAKRAEKGEDPNKGFDMLDMMWNSETGKVDRDAGAFVLSPYLQTIRGMNTASLLTSATLSTVTDPLMAMLNAGFKGMNPLETLGSYVKNFVKSVSKRGFEDQQIMGLGADVFSSEVTRRYSELGEGFWAKASEAVMRATFMNVLTESARQAFKVQFMKKLLNGRNITDLTTDEHIKILEQVNEAADYAVIMGNSRSRAFTTMGKEKGTIGGEITRSTMQFLTFPITFMVMQGSRILRQGSVGSRIGYAAGLFTVTTVGGAIAMIAKDAAKGYGAREGLVPWSDEYDDKQKIKFWGAAAMQGGGIGIFSDFLFSDVNRFGQGKSITTLGPTAGLAGDAWDLTYGNVQKAFDPDEPDTHFGVEAVEFVNRHANPLKVWYVNAIMEQYITRNIKIMLDDDYERTERKKIRKREREYGQEKFEWLQD
jgi:hypothetical protein